MDLDQLALQFPHLWHVTFAGGWEGIRRHGLMTAHEVNPVGSSEIRSDPINRALKDGLPITLRDQLRSRIDPTPYLDGLTTAEWWQLLNCRVDFFRDQKTANDLVASYLRRRHPQEIIKIRTNALLKTIVDRVEATTVNAGVFPRVKGPTRGRTTFLALSSFPSSDATKVREITVVNGLSLPIEAVTSVVRCDVDGTRRRLFP